MGIKKNDTTVGDVLKDHFGVNNIREARERRNSVLEQERIEQYNVELGNAPRATSPEPARQVTYTQSVPDSVQNATSTDSK